MNEISHIKFNWTGGDYSASNAMMDTLSGEPFWKTIVMAVIICALFIFFWLRNGDSWTADDGGHSRMEEKPLAGLPSIRWLIPVGACCVASIFAGAVIYGSFSSTLNSGRDYAFRAQIADQLADHGIYVNTGDVPSAHNQASTGIVSRTQDARSGRTCTISNLEPDMEMTHKTYKIAVICDGQPLQMN